MHDSMPQAMCVLLQYSKHKTTHGGSQGESDTVNLRMEDKRMNVLWRCMVLRSGAAP